MTTPIPLGIYRHYKGDLYTVIGFVRHHETDMTMVLYVSHDKGQINCRPLYGWNLVGALDEYGWLDKEYDGGYWIPRFTLVKEAPSQERTIGGAPSRDESPHQATTSSLGDGVAAVNRTLLDREADLEVHPEALENAASRAGARYASHQLALEAKVNPDARISDELLGALAAIDEVASPAPWFWETQTHSIIEGLRTVCALATPVLPNGKHANVVNGNLLVLMRNALGPMIRELQYHRSRENYPICSGCASTMTGIECRDCGIVVR